MSDREAAIRKVLSGPPPPPPPPHVAERIHAEDVSDWRMQRDERQRQLNADTAERLRDLARLIDSMAEAMETEDEILGSLAGSGLAMHLPGLPKHVRDVFMEYLSDEAARSYRADILYINQEAP